MKTNATKRSVGKKTLAALILSSLAVPVMMIQNAEAVGTKAGVTIGNQATAKYKDVNLNSFKASSNLVVTVIDNVFDILITQGPLQTDNSQKGAPVQAQNATPNTVVYYPYVLTNTGNAPDIYTMNTVPAATNPKAVTNLKLYIDNDGDGRVSVGDIEILATGKTPTINPDQSLKLVVQYQLPLNAAATETYAVDLVGSSDGSTAPGYTKGAKNDGTVAGANVLDENFNVTTVVTSAVVAITKSVDHSTANPLDPLLYTFKLDNTGNQDSTYVKFTDNIPANTVAIVGSEVNTPFGTWTYWNGVDGTGSPVVAAGRQASVKSVTFEMGSPLPATVHVLPAANSRVVSFKVQVTATAPAGTIPNNAKYGYTNEVGTNIVDPANPTQSTNIVTTDINKKSAVALSPADAAYNTFIPFDGTGDATLANDALGTDTTTLASAPAGTYIFYKNVVTNNGNANDSFNIEWDSAASTLPAGANVTFFRISDPAVGVNNNLPLLDTNNDGKIDTGIIPPHINADGSTNSFGQIAIVAKVFIPSNITGGPYTAALKATSSNGGSPVAATPTQALSDTTRDTVTAIVAPALNIYNVIAGADSKLIPSFTASQDGTTVSYPIDVWNKAPLLSAPDTYNLSASTIAGIPSATVQFFPLKVLAVLTAAGSKGDNTITVSPASASSMTVGDKITLNGQTLDIYGKNNLSGLITFGLGQSLFAAVANGSTVVTSAPAPVSSTGVLNPQGFSKFLAMVTVPKGTTSQSTSVTFTQTSNNDTTKSDTVTDDLVIPQFKDFKLETNRAGSAPAGGVLFYDHIVTNTGNIADTYTLDVPATGSHGLSYQIIDQTGAVVPSTSFITPAPIPVGGTYTFKVKVTIPQGTPNNTVDTEIISATNTNADPLLKTKTNTDITSVVDGFLSLVKSVQTLNAATTNNPALPADIKDATGAKADPNDILEYTIKFTNIGSSNAIDSIVEDIIPANTKYEANSLRITFDGSPVISSVNALTPTPTMMSDTADGDDAEEDNVAHVVRYRVGTPPVPASGGIVPQGKSGTVTFRVRVD